MLRLLAGRRAQVAVALLVYVGYTVYLTWPLATDLDSLAFMYQPPGQVKAGGDTAGTVATLRELVNGYHNPFAPGRLPDFNAPAGRPIPWSLNLATAPTTLILYGLTMAFEATAAVGVFVIAAYLASAIAMFLLVRKLTASFWIALLIGWAFAFFPYAAITGEHIHYIHSWVFVLIAWRTLRVLEEPTLRNGLFVAGATILAITWTPFFLLLAGVCYATLTALALAAAAFSADRRRHATAHLVGASVMLLFLFALRQLVVTAGAPAFVQVNTLEAISVTSARPLMYLLPTEHHFLFGDLTRDFLATRRWDNIEFNLYMGLSLLCLALIGGLAALWRRGLPRGLVAPAFCFSGLTVVALLLSAPPQNELFGQLVPFPSYLVWKIEPGFRILARFVIVAMLGVCLLAALGLKVLSGLGAGKLRTGLLALSAVVVPLDLWTRPPGMTFHLDAVPSIYSKLRNQPPGILAEYPLRPVDNPGHYLDLLFQEDHGKPILNGYYADEGEGRALAVARLDDPATAGRLATLGVRYILRTPPGLAPLAEPSGPPGTGFRLIGRDRYGALHRVTADPSPFAKGEEGFWITETGPKKHWQWMTASRATIEAYDLCGSCDRTLRFRLSSFARPRRVAIFDQSGRRLVSERIGTRSRAISLTVRLEGRTKLTITASPGPQSISEATGTADPRSVAIQIQPLPAK